MVFGHDLICFHCSVSGQSVETYLMELPPYDMIQYASLLSKQLVVDLALLIHPIKELQRKFGWKVRRGGQNLLDINLIFITDQRH